jgi:hypothetical protein
MGHLSGGMPYGLQAMLKEGYQHLSGLDEAVLKNIEACKALSQLTKSSMGPNGTRIFATIAAVAVAFQYVIFAAKR